MQINKQYKYDHTKKAIVLAFPFLVSSRLRAKSQSLERFSLTYVYTPRTSKRNKTKNNHSLRLPYPCVTPQTLIQLQTQICTNNIMNYKRPHTRGISK